MGLDGLEVHLPIQVVMETLNLISMVLYRTLYRF